MASRNRGKPKGKLRDISREHPSAEERNKLMQALLQGLTTQTPIVIAVLGAALLELEIEKLLRPRFKKKDDETWATMTDHGAPLSGFHSKIIMAYAMGHYDETVRDNMHIVRNIRNVFAHAKKIFGFDHPLIISELKKIKLPTRAKSEFHRSLRAAKTVSHAESAFVGLVLALTGELQKRNIALMSAGNRSAKLGSGPIN